MGIQSRNLETVNAWGVLTMACSARFGVFCFYFMYIGVLLLSVSESPELELQTVVGCHVEAEN